MSPLKEAFLNTVADLIKLLLSDVAMSIYLALCFVMLIVAILLMILGNLAGMAIFFAMAVIVFLLQMARHLLGWA